MKGPAYKHPLLENALERRPTLAALDVQHTLRPGVAQASKALTVNTGASVILERKD